MISAEKSPGDTALDRLCSSLLNLANVEPNILKNWLRHVIIGATVPSPAPATTGETPSPASVTLAVSEVSAPTTTATSKPDKTEPPSTKKTLLEQHQLLLQYLTSYIVKDNNR